MSRYLGDYTEDDMLYFIWSTNDANGASITRTTDGTISVYKDNSVAQSVAGITDTEDFDSLTGIHLCTIDLSNDAFYAVGADYSVVLSGASIDGKAVNAVLAHFSIENRFMVDVSDLPTNAEFEARTILAAAYFDPAADAVANVTLVATTTDVTNQVSADITGVSGSATSADNLEAQYDGVTGLTGDLYPSTQAQVGNIASGTAATNTVASTAVVTSGNETLTYTATAALDGVTHDVAPAAAITDFYYEFNVGGNGVPVGIQWQGYANSVGDEYIFYAYNWVGTSWDQIGTKIGLSGTTIVTQQMDMTTAHVGTGANLGIVRFRVFSTGASTGTNISTDRILCSFSTVFQSVGYANGQIWIDTLNGTAGTATYVNGTADNPVLTWADALTISSNLNITSFNIANGSTVTLSGDSSNYTLTGENWILALNGQTIAGAYFHGANVSGIGLNGGDNPDFEHCLLGTCSLPAFSSTGCGISSTITLTEAGTYIIESSFSAVAGTSAPIIDFGALIGNTNVNFRHYSGGIDIRNLGQVGTDNMSLEGQGQYILNANCIGGTLAVRGSFQKTDNSGLVIISDDANLYTGVIESGRSQAGSDNTITLASTASAVDGAYDPSVIATTGGTGAKQSRLILEYNGTTKVAVVDRNWKVNPDSTTDYKIVANAGREHVNEGLAQAGAAGTITLNALASASDDAYNGQVIFLRSGTGEDQARWITDYNGTTKVAIVNSNWAVNPDVTTGYVVLPSGMQNLLTAIAGDAMDLVPDAIKATTYDGTTAFPVISVDSGATEIARTGADGDTLETLSDEIAAVPTAAENKTAMEANNSDLDYLVTDLINKKSIKIADGKSTQYNDADGLIGTLGTGYSDDGTDVVRPRQVIAK